jgi:DNA adenine methylase
MQKRLFVEGERRKVAPLKSQLLKWIGNKQRFAHEIVSYFPSRFGRYFEPFLGSGAVLATLAPISAVGSDVFQPLMEIWQTLRKDPAKVVQWYTHRWHVLRSGEKVGQYEKIKASYNATPNGADLLLLCRSCYGGVVRFRKADGCMSTPCGVHAPVPPEAFAHRVNEWHKRTAGTEFLVLDFAGAMKMARKGDLVYCDPPYQDSQTILYGAQSFRLEKLYAAISECKARGVFVALSIDGSKRSGGKTCAVRIPAGLFEREVFVNCGRSMLRRFQMGGRTLEGELVADRLLLTV